MATGWGGVGGGGGAWGGTSGAWGAPRAQDEEAPPAYTPPEPEPAPVSANTAAAFGAASSGRYGQAAAPGSFNNSAVAGGSNPQLQIREEQLKKREAELAAKEKQLKEFEKKLIEAGHIKPPNWPFWCWKFLHHDISEEIPERSRRPVREAYTAWLFAIICFLWQVFCASVILGSEDGKRVSSWFFSLIYAICGIPAGFYFWYWRLYNGAKEDSTLSFISFFFWFGIHTIWCIWCAVAPSFGYAKWAFSGFMTAFQAFDIGDFQGVIYLIGGGLWAAEATLSVWIIRDVWYFFRGQGGVKQVQQEAALAAFRAQVQSGSTRQ